MTEGQYDTNPLLLTDGEDDVFGFAISPGVRVDHRTRNTNFHVGGSVTYNDFTGSGRDAPGFDDLDSFDQHADTGFSWQGARDTFNANARVDRAPTRTTEVLETGVLSAETTRTSYGGDMTYGFGLTEIDTLDLTVEGENVTYDDQDVLSDFASYGGGLGYRRQLTPVDEGGVSFLYTRFDTQSEDFGDANLIQGSLDWIRQPSPGFRTAVSAGATYVETEEGPPGSGVESDSVVRPYLLAELDWNVSPVDVIGASIRSSVRTSGAGTPQDQFRIGADYTHQITRVVAFDLSASYIQQESVIEDVSDKREYFEISPGVSWLILRDVLLTTKYRYRTQEFDTADDAAESHAVFLTLTYNMPPLPLF